MCSNYRTVTRADRLLTFFGVERSARELPAEVWPVGLAPFIRLAPAGSPTAKWICDDGLFGLLPGFQTEVSAGRKTYNARTETVATKPSFRESWRKGWRCIIPSEWIYEPNWESGKAVRWRISKPGEVPMGIAGIYREWCSPDGVLQFTFAMLTVNADGHPIMQRFHRPEDEKRMVVILDEKDYGKWLSCPVGEASKFFRQWMGPLDAFPAPLPPRAPRAVSGKSVVPPSIDDPGLI